MGSAEKGRGHRLLAKISAIRRIRRHAETRRSHHRRGIAGMHRQDQGSLHPRPRRDARTRLTGTKRERIRRIPRRLQVPRMLRPPLPIQGDKGDLPPPDPMTLGSAWGTNIKPLNLRTHRTIEEKAQPRCLGGRRTPRASIIPDVHA